MAFPLFLPSYTKKLCKLTTYLVFFHYNYVYTNKLYYYCLCATELGISFIQGKNVMKKDITYKLNTFTDACVFRDLLQIAGIKWHFIDEDSSEQEPEPLGIYYTSICANIAEDYRITIHNIDDSEEYPRALDDIASFMKYHDVSFSDLENKDESDEDEIDEDSGVEYDARGREL